MNLAVERGFGRNKTIVTKSKSEKHWLTKDAQKKRGITQVSSNKEKAEAFLQEIGVKSGPLLTERSFENFLATYNIVMSKVANVIQSHVSRNGARYRGKQKELRRLPQLLFNY
ncbi:hypothetical protein EQG49_12585 [Periweissella cryptocerci]|uniref:Uncharacterized protein n=1 Tax=Periweissella cryptocerci TaxID=2506420 RepID=A0A4P6YWM9_9LACO|nr:hypothetical protein [Periweissella cryptocerci]QBO37234.1 hypothetical protein EQG49_12585 [Periweissella cryptocerci]